MLTVKNIIKNKIFLPSVFLALILSLVVIPLIIASLTPISLSLPKGIHIKSGSHLFYNFLENIKQTNDILVLGTSETGNSLNGNNYFSLLNRDTEFNKSVYALGGAGRSANVYFPLILDNPAAFKNLNIIYYINPTYWRNGLNKFNETYANRYIESSLVNYVKEAAKTEDVFDNFMNPGENYNSHVSFLFSRAIDRFKSLYYHDLNLVLSEKEIIPIKKVNLKTIYDSTKITNLKQQIDLEFNVTNEFLRKNSDFPSINTESTYQYDLLFSFIQLCKKNEINCTFYLGPYNEIYCQKKNPELKNEHLIVINSIRDLLINSQVDFIDGSSISSIPGTFMDIQHISEYGAYLTAIQIKEHYEKKNN